MDMTEEELQALLAGGGDIANMDAEIAKAKAMAELIRNYSPQMHMRGNGRIQTASSPLEAVASLGGAYLQKQQLDKQGAAETGKAAAMTKQNQGVLAALLRQRRPQATGGQAFPQRPMPGEDEELGYASPL